MPETLVVVGAGGFGREVLDVVDAVNAAAEESVWTISGVVDDRPTDANLAHLRTRGIDYLGTTEQLLTDRAALGATHYVVGIGNPGVRRRVAETFDAAGLVAATLEHPSVTRGYDVEVGAGSVLCAGVRITTHIRIGRHVHLNLNATVGHDTTVGDHVSVNPLASISGDCVIEDEVLIGVSGVVLNGLRVGRGSVVGGSACVVKDVPADVVVKGIPAR
ncbi:NeuD/PglB/VioB family sugar acetyltransferase [Nocardioides renjunii]|uniref:NeuD/PglB/VioB family sugar acetyltransferase n=1 Tax=Nocardioides renjunii TaxID=3095075 RepID=UPI002AFE6F1F|nr:NeuD/PglB/VioB family sugar acetyltransferase [Nocardioides sp. S-34]WQQ22154.1 NeuD/PglB/VioB family sugar acetyltransferase [Nocardioides sp. S-34]